MGTRHLWWQRWDRLVEWTAGVREEASWIQKRIEETVIARRLQRGVFAKVALRGRRCGTQRPNCSRTGRPELGVIVRAWEELGTAETENVVIRPRVMKSCSDLKTGDQLIRGNRRVKCSTIWRGERRSTYTAHCVWWAWFLICWGWHHFDLWTLWYSYRSS